MKASEFETRRVPIGVPGDEIEAALKTWVSAADPVQLELPGGIFRAGPSWGAAILPMARVIVREDAGPSSSLVVRLAAQGDTPTEVRTGSLAPAGFSLLAESSGLTFGDLAKSAARGPGARKSPAEVELTMRFALEGGSVQDFGPFGGQLAADIGEEEEEKGPKGEPEGWFFFDCHSHWYFRDSAPPGRHFSTICHGPCDQGEGCLIPPLRHQRAYGWHFCFCLDRNPEA